MTEATQKSLEDLAQRLRVFAAERDWEQFHAPKNLSMALTVEAAELQQEFQWLAASERIDLDEKALSRIEQEIGDVLIYLVRLADRLAINPLDVAYGKLTLNERKYPAEKVRGSAAKYTEYESD